MSILVRCPCCTEQPDGSVTRCRYPKRVEMYEVDPRVGCPRFQCHNCGVILIAWVDANGQPQALEAWS